LAPSGRSSIEGVDVGALIEERPDGAKASLRCKHAGVRVDQIAAAFGGGGHACAAGLNTRDDVATLYSKLIATIEAQLTRIDAARR
jgi:bifunctional oligoribonuclease and PAP phosphatase NrnA